MSFKINALIISILQSFASNDDNFPHESGLKIKKSKQIPIDVMPVLSINTFMYQTFNLNNNYIQLIFY